MGDPDSQKVGDAGHSSTRLGPSFSANQSSGHVVGLGGGGGGRGGVVSFELVQGCLGVWTQTPTQPRK